MEESIKELIKILGVDRVRLDEPMKNHTTFRIGGPADVYFESNDPREIKTALESCRRLKIPYFILGIGANILVSDAGIRGLVIKPTNCEMAVLGSLTPKEGVNKGSRGEHYRQHDTENYLKFDDLDLPEPPPDTLVRVGAGVSLPVLIAWSLDNGLTGLQNFSGIPSSVGGALYNNIHGGTKLFSEFVHEVTLINETGNVVTVVQEEMGFAYDQSRLQGTKELVLEVTLKLSHGDLERAKWVREEWLKRKLKVQPQSNCPGCIFKNISSSEASRIGSPTVSAGWVVDAGLGLKGAKIGGVSVSKNHANFFVNDGTGKAQDVLELINICKTKTREKFGLGLKEEIQLVGEF